MGEKSSVLKDAATSAMAAFGNVANAAAGDAPDSLRPLQQCLSEERAIASFVEDSLRATGMRYLQLRSEGRQASR